MEGRGLAWPLAALACAVIAAGVALLWIVNASLGISVGIPAGATVVAAIMTWAGSVPPRAGQTTSEQLERARQVLAERCAGQLRTLARPGASEAPLPPLPPLAKTLAVRWTAHTQPVFDGPSQAGTEDAVRLAGRLRGRQPLRLFVVGSPGCGKTALGRLLTAELLRQAGPGDQVPVFLPFTSWNPDRQSLREWIACEIRRLAPELDGRASYGSAAIASLMGHGKVLPVLDGLDTLPAGARRAFLASDDFLEQPRVVVTCRSREFAETAAAAPAPGTVVLTPGRVPAAEAEGFLRHSAASPAAWDPVFRDVTDYPDGPLARALSDPRLIYLAAIAYKDQAPAGLIAGPALADAGDVESRILAALPGALLSADDEWRRSSPWYRDRSVEWLRYLAGTVSQPGTGEVAWGSIFRAVPRLYRRQRIVRTVAGSLAAAMLIAFFNRYRGEFTVYGWLTGAAYGLGIACACYFLSPAHATRRYQEFRRPAYRWWLRRTWAGSRGVIVASLAATILFGLTIDIRAHVLHGSHPNSTAAVDGIVAGMVVGLSSVIARIPSAPRSGPLTEPEQLPGSRAAGAGVYSLSARTSIGLASGLGVLFGLISGILAVVEHQDAPGGPRMVKALAFGIIMGLNFAVGTWLVSLARAHTISGWLPDPMSAFRAERKFALLAIAIMAMTFASAFSLNSSLGWSRYSAIPNGIVGAIAGSLVSEWPLYLAAVAITAARGRLPLRLMKFLEVCRAQGVLRAEGTAYRFREIKPWIQADSTASPGTPAVAGAGGEPGKHPAPLA